MQISPKLVCNRTDDTSCLMHEATSHIAPQRHHIGTILPGPILLVVAMAPYSDVTNSEISNLKASATARSMYL